MLLITRAGNHGFNLLVHFQIGPPSYTRVYAIYPRYNSIVDAFHLSPCVWDSGTENLKYV